MLYRPVGLFGYLIAIKTWHSISHCEMYIGNGRSVASRDGIGVGDYPVRYSQLAYIMRPNVPFDLDAALAKFRSVYQGQGYDWKGLLRFASRAEVHPERFRNKQFCSELLTRLCRDGHMKPDPFNGDDADAIAPFEFAESPDFTRNKVTKDGQVLGCAR